jgi:hypothetical protein
MRYPRVPAILALCAALGAALGAAGPAGGASIPPVNGLVRVESTRSQAFGGGAVAVGNDPTLIWVNPAATANAQDSALAMGANRGYFGDLAGHALYTQPFGNATLAAALLYYDAGYAESYDEEGNYWKVPIQSDMAAAFGYAVPLTGDVTTGANFKYCSSKVGGNTSYHSFLGDGGVQVRVTNELKVGFALANLGPPIEITGESYAPPAVARVGGAAGWRLGDGPRPSTVILVGDCEYQVASKLSSFRGGVEYHWRGMVAMRAGGRFGSYQEPGVFGGGIGLKLGNYRLDYTLRHSTVVDMPQTITLTVSLGKRVPLKASAPGDAANPVPSAPLPEAAPTPSLSPEGQLPPPVPAIPDSETSFTLPTTTPSATEAEQGPPPPEMVPPAPSDNEVIDDLNRRLDELLEKEKSRK